MSVYNWIEGLEHKLGHSVDELSEQKARIIRHLRERTVVSRDMSGETGQRDGLGARLADRVAEFGGSWQFIMIFCGVLVLWTSLNTFVLITNAFDPYPFIFLNLMLSMVAALQAPIIMMSQNRQAAKDRAAAEHDYEVNLKAELEIMALHEKLDQLRNEHMAGLLARQEEQMNILAELLKSRADKK